MNEQLQAAASAALGGNLFVSGAFVIAVSFAVYLLWTEKYKALFGSKSPAKTVADLAGQALDDLVKNAISKLKDVQSLAPSIDVSVDVPESNITLEKALEIVAPLPADKQLSLISLGLSEVELWKATRDFLADRLYGKGDHAS